MLALCMNKLLTSGAGVLYIATVIAWGEGAFAANLQTVSLGRMWNSGNSFLAQSSPTSPLSDARPKPSSSPSPARVPEPAMLAGLGVVAGSFALTRRRAGKKEL